MQKNHSNKCKYKDSDKLLYCCMVIEKDTKILISAYEYSLFETYLNLAHEKDKDIFVDMDTTDNYPFIIMYGGVMFCDTKFDKLQEDFNKLKNCALIRLTEEKPYNIIASSYEDIVFFPDEAESEGFIPFAALMRTDCKLHNSDYSETMFPYTGRLVWEDLVNRNFLFACRESIDLPESVTTKNWKDYIDHDLLLEKYRVADLCTSGYLMRCFP